MKRVVLTMAVVAVLATACAGSSAPESRAGGPAAEAQGSTYYVSPAGSDRASGRSPATAWRTLDKVNRRRLRPGDTVLFQAGGVWQGSLAPTGSGTSSRPITFGVYGKGRWVIDGAGTATTGISLGSDNDHIVVEDVEIRRFDHDRSAIYLAGASHLRLIRIDAHDNSNGLWDSPNEAPSKDVLVLDSTFSGYPSGTQLFIGNLESKGWRVIGTEIANSGDSCVIDLAGHSLYRSVRIHHCGYAPPTEVPWQRHGIYAKGPDITVLNSRVWDVGDKVAGGGQCVSMREGGLVQGNLLHDCVGGIGFFDYTRRAQQTLTIRRNRIWGFTAWGIYLDTVESNSENRLSVPDHRVDFLIVNNSIVATRGRATGISFAGAAPGYGLDVRLANNIVTGNLEPALSAFSALPEGANGSFHGENNIYWSTAGATELMFRGHSTSKANLPGDRDSVVANPGLRKLGSSFALRAHGRAVDFGTPRVPGVKLVASCNGTATSYCGRAPDAGAVESACCRAAKARATASTARRARKRG